MARSTINKLNKQNLQKAAAALAFGAIGVLPTDTIYGIVASALEKESVERVYRVRQRNPKKPVIILIGALEDLALFGIAPDIKTKKLLAKWWPGKVSVIFPLKGSPLAIAKLNYLHRGTKTLAFRLPKPLWLRELLVVTGPLIAPSANLEGEPPAANIKDAKKYFRDTVDFYMDAGALNSKPSTLVAIAPRGKVAVLRQGAVHITSAKP